MPFGEARGDFSLVTRRVRRDVGQQLRAYGRGLEHRGGGRQRRYVVAVEPFDHRREALHELGARSRRRDDGGQLGEALGRHQRVHERSRGRVPLHARRERAHTGLEQRDEREHVGGGRVPRQPFDRRPQRPGDQGWLPLAVRHHVRGGGGGRETVPHVGG